MSLMPKKQKRLNDKQQQLIHNLLSSKKLSNKPSKNPQKKGAINIAPFDSCILFMLYLAKHTYFDKSRPRLASIAKRRPFKRMKPSASF